MFRSRFCNVSSQGMLKYRVRDRHTMSKKRSKQTKQESGDGATSAATADNLQGAVASGVNGNIIISVLAKPGAKQNGITGISEEGVGIQIAAPPMDGKANTELIRYLAKTLGLRKSDITMDRGSKSRTKRLLIDSATGLTAEYVTEKLKNEIDSG